MTQLLEKQWQINKDNGKLIIEDEYAKKQVTFINDLLGQRLKIKLFYFLNPLKLVRNLQVDVVVQYVEDFCLAYHCKMGTEWVVDGEACICTGDELWADANTKLREFDSMFNTNLKTNDTDNETQLLRR